MTKRRNPWERGIEARGREYTERDKLVYNTSRRRFLTITETAMYLRCTPYLVKKMIAKGVIELSLNETGTSYVKRRSLDGLLMPVRSLNKRLKLLKEIESEIEHKILERKQKLETLKTELPELPFKGSYSDNNESEYE